MYPTNYPPPHPRPSTAHPRQEQRVGRRQSVHHLYHQPPSSASNQSYPPSVPTAYTSANSRPAGSHLYQQQSYASSQPYQGQQHLPPNQQQHYVQLNVSAEAQWRSYQQNNPGASRPPVGFLPSPSDSQFTTVTSHQEHPQYHRVNLNHGSYPNNNNTPTMNSPNDPSTFFPILATTQAAMDQSVQTDQQVTAILSLPPTILAKLARTPDIDQQQRILVDSRLDPQILPIMSLSAPEPCPSKTQPANSSTSIGTLATTTSTTPIISQSISQHAIPHILHHVFSPYSNSIFVPVNEPTYPQQNYQPSYRSVDEWAIQVAQQTAASSPIDPEYIAGQLKQWALHSQDTQLEQHVHEAKAHAVLLAAQAEAVIQSAPSPDLTPYANTYKTQLAQVASGYYTELHRAAINQLDPTRTAAGAQPPLPPTPQTAVCPALKTSTSLADPDTSTSTHSTNSCSITSGCDIAVSLSTVTATCNTAPITSSALQSEDNLNAEPTRTATVVHHTDYPSDPSKLSSQFPSESSHHQHQHHHHLPSSFSSTTTPTSAAATTTSTHTLFGSSSAPHLRNGHRPLNMLTSTLTAPSQADNTHSALDKISSQNVQAAAAAALTANFMASTDLASRAGQTLSILGMTVQTKLTTPVPPPGPAAIAATQHSLALAHQQQQQQHHHQLINQSTSAPMMPQNHIHHHHMTSNNHSLPLIPNPAQAHPHSQMISAQRPLSSLPGSLRSPHTSTTMLNTCSSISNPPGASSVIGAHHAAPNEPPNYVSQVERIWRSAQEGQCTERARDYLLSYAHAVYSKKPNDPCLLPLLHTLIKLHPKHLPTLLLLSCVYYSQGDYDSSLFHNDQILILDPEYVEAMSNVGTTKRALGNWAEAEEWWWRAIKLRPTYFDAFDNLLGVLCNPQSPPAAPSINSVQPPSAQPRYDEALRLCTFVETALFGPLDQQNLFYAKGNLLIAMGRASQARQEYEKALEVVCGSPLRKSTPSTSNPSGGYALIDLVLATTSIGIFMMALNGSMSGSIGDPMVLKALSATGIWDPNQCGYQTILADPLKAAHQRRQIIKSKLLQMGGGIIPCVLLLPESLDQLIATVFNATNRVLPVFQNHSPTSSNGESIRNPAFQSANQTTSTVLLTLAKCLQDAISAPMGIGENESSLDGIPPSSSLLLSLYYIAITLHPSASTCNNLGILLSTIPSTLTLNNPSQGRRVINGQQIAHTFYVQGLQKDRNHPHLYTNLGSLLKDMGQLPQAVSMYEKAVQCNPNFDVALANLANAIKDMGRVQESVQWYERAVLINPNFPEAVCGLVNALGGVCDWRDRGAVGSEPVVDESGKLLGPPTPAADGKLRAGLMGKVSRLVDKQLDEGMAYGRGVMRQAASLAQWLEAIAIVKTGRMDGLSEEESKKWRCKFEVFCGSTSQDSRSVTATGTDRYNEGGFLIRLIERCNRQIQRRWYVDTYGKVVSLTKSRGQPIELPIDGSLSKYRRLSLPSALPVPPVPTVLPFHTFTYPLTARECRLISHRNALRISLTTLNQPWIPSSVYPPPPPPCPEIDERSDPPGLARLRVGYVSSDFNNHPLAHLMQSVFGIHNRSQFAVVCYATTASDGSIYRKKIEQEVETFKDVSGWAHNEVIKEILKDRIHILINLNGYTKGAKNEIFAARPCPVQMEFMGFAGTLASGWTDWIIADPVVCPPRMVSGERWRKRHLLSQLESFCSSSDGQEVQANSHASRVAELGREETRMVELVDDGPTDFDGDLDPENMDESWVYTEKFIYMPHSYFVCDHKQGFREELAQDISGGVDLNGVPLNFKHEPLHQALRPLTTHEQPALPKELAGKEAEWEIEEFKRWKMRKEIFPDLDDQTVIFANFNQLYKIDPLIFKYWLEILAAIPNSILWLLRFPAPGEPHLKITAERWAGREVAGRIRFTDVAPKPIHIKRGRIADLFLDSTECNAHTTAADILWSGTPILTLPRPTHAHKMCSRVAASIALATGHGSRMIATSMEDYKERAIQFGRSVRYIPRQQTRTGTGGYMSGELVEGGLIELRQRLFFNREKSALFDTVRWTRNLESGLWEAWKRFVEGSDSEESAEWKSAGSESSPESLKSAMKSCSIWIQDSDDDLGPDHLDRKMARLERRQFIADEMKNDLDHS
ncbi:hypothetical protein Pst134EA_007055 [Puccinia striiformis f. sp. tritici]|uniref:hypothetical protein n=1 Tax=Puccinia striiformis f. sp. tritici TaxID=168172 RepID=UPI0020087C18|nr:hypothetical protein Pst134EA_007055 [Puccinia striiformis f. sp. tritici]KAH9469778.1 hypothetical protein Pst134EA_007055 [Puccinia striiformis f. sp. tritici]